MIKRGITRKAITAILLAICLLLSGCGGKSAFDGSRTSEETGFRMEYSILDKEESAEMKLTEGDQIQVHISHTAGNVDVIVGQNGEEPIYKGTEQENADFILTIPKTGCYHISVTGHRAEGAISFTVFYIAAGLSDMLDGFVARKTDTVSKLGARLDTIADFVLVVVCLIKLLPVLRIPAWLYIWIGIIALIKVVNIISGFVVQKRFVAVHSAMNKATGALLFLLPLTILVFPLKNSAIVDCAAATFAAIQEGHFIRTGRE